MRHDTHAQVMALVLLADLLHGRLGFSPICDEQYAPLPALQPAEKAHGFLVANKLASELDGKGRQLFADKGLLGLQAMLETPNEPRNLLRTSSHLTSHPSRCLGQTKIVGPTSTALCG